MATSGPGGAVLPGNRALITLSVMLAAFMQSVDISIANVSLPHMQGSLSAAQDQITWVLTSYIVAAAITIPLTGWLAGRFGRKRVLLVSIAGFTVASVLCGMAGTLTQMVLFRLLQGVCGAALQPLAQSVLLDVNPRERHGRAMATWGMGITFAPLLGPTLGGWITETYNWRWVFYINLPVGILAFLGILAFFRDNRLAERRPFDFFGFAVLSMAIGALQMMLDRGQQNDWFGSLETIIECAVAISGLWIFVVHAATAKHSFVNPKVLQNSNFLSCGILIFVMASLFNSTLALTPPLLQNLLGYTAFQSGWIVMPRGIANMMGLFVVGRLIGKVDPRILLFTGFGVTSFGLWMMTHFALTMDREPMVVASFVQGLGIGFIFAPLTTTAFATLAPALRTEATTFYSLVRNIGGSTGIATFETLLSQGIQSNHQVLATQVTPYNQALAHPAVQSFWNIHTDAGLMHLNAEVTRQASMIAYIEDFRLMALWAAFGIPLLLLLRIPKPGAPRPAE